MFTPQGPASYACNDPVLAASWLVEQGYRTEEPRSQHEYLRLRKERSLIVVYHNGTVLMQGADTQTPRSLFASAPAVQPVTDMLPF